MDRDLLREELYKRLQGPSEDEDVLAGNDDATRDRAFVASLSDAASRAGQIGGERNKSDTLWKLNDEMRKTDVAQSKANIDRQKLKLELAKSLKEKADEKSKFTTMKGAKAPTGKALQEDQYGNQRLVDLPPGASFEEEKDAGTVMNDFESEDGSILIRHKDGSFSRGMPPAGFTKKKPKDPEDKITDSQRNSAYYHNNAANAAKTLDDMESKGYRPSAAVAAANAAMGMKGFAGDLSSLVANYGLTKDDLLYLQAARDFTAAKLRPESGASIPPSEISEQAKIYMAQNGEPDEVLVNKQKSRGEAIKGLRFKAGRAADELAQMDGGGGEKDQLPTKMIGGKKYQKQKDGKWYEVKK